MVVQQNTGERHPTEATALSIIQGQLANRVVYMQAATPSVFLSPSLMHTQVWGAYMHNICMLLCL